MNRIKSRIIGKKDRKNDTRKNVFSVYNPVNLEVALTGI
jgi:hypothetical protein